MFTMNLFLSSSSSRCYFRSRKTTIGTEKESVSASKMGKVADRFRLQNEKSTRKRLLFSELARLDRSNLGFKQSGTTKTRQLQQLRSKIVTATF